MGTLSRRRLLQVMAGGAGVALLGAGARATEAAVTAPIASPARISPRGRAQVNITYWGSFSGNLGEAEQAMVKRFNDSQSDVFVDYQFQGSYEDTAQKLTAALQARQAPDVSLLSDVWWFSFYVNRVLQPMDEYMSKYNVPADDYVEALFKEGVRKGSVYWVPFARSTPIFYYNKEAWSEAGLPDRGPKTWDEFVQWAPGLMKRDSSGSVQRYAFAHPGAASYVAWLFQGVIWQWGGRYSDPDFKIRINEPEGVAAGEFYRSTVRDGWAYTPQDPDTDFRTGLTAAMMGSTAGLRGHMDNSKFTVGAAFLPEGPKGFGCCTGGSGLAILAGSPKEKQEAAFQYIAFATSPDQTAIWSQSTGYMPVRKSALEGAAMQDFYQQRPQFLTAVQQLPLTQPQDAARVFIRNGDQIIGKGLERILIQQESPQDVWNDVAQTLDKAADGVRRQLRQVEG